MNQHDNQGGIIIESFNFPPELFLHNISISYKKKSFVRPVQQRRARWPGLCPTPPGQTTTWSARLQSWPEIIQLFNTECSMKIVFFSLQLISSTACKWATNPRKKSQCSVENSWKKNKKIIFPEHPVLLNTQFFLLAIHISQVPLSSFIEEITTNLLKIGRILIEWGGGVGH